MLQEQSNQSITKKIFVETLGKFTDEVLLPGVEGLLDKRINPLEKKVDNLEKKVDNLEKKVDNLEATVATQLPDKEFLTDRLGDLAVELTLKMKKDRDRLKRFTLIVSAILKRSEIATKKEKEALTILEKEFAAI